MQAAIARQSRGTKFKRIYTLNFRNLPNNLVYDAGSTNTLTFRVKNSGDLEGQTNLKLVMLGYIRSKRYIWLKPGGERI